MIETKNDIKNLDAIVKSVTQDCLQLIKVWNKSNGFKKMKKIQTNQKNIPKNEIIEVSEKMSEFLSNHTSLKDSYTKINVTRAILDYIQTQELNKNNDIITFDEPLLYLFEDKNDTSFFELHKLIATHFILHPS
jgi:chromatin remodeling complex protein RSC6